MGCGLGLGLGLGLNFTLGLDSMVSGWAEEVFGGIEVANFWEFAVRLFTGNQITTRGLGFSGNEAEEVFASENDRNANKCTIFVKTHYGDKL